MSKSDIIIVGAGMAGLTAALVAAQAGKSVTIIAAGAGALSIGSGCIDLLGYLDGTAVQGDPLEAIASLPAEHPYQRIGISAVREALAFFSQLCAERQWNLLPTTQGNHWLPTIMGTLKPSYLCPQSADATALGQARSITVLGIEGIKDCQPMLIAQQLQKYPHLQGKHFNHLHLPSPFGQTHRSINALDLARHIDTEAGLTWLLNSLKALSLNADALLIPPICGTHAHAHVYTQIQQTMKCAVVEMLSIPPGVGGLRLREIFLQALRAYPVNMVENSRVCSARIEGEHCVALMAHSSSGIKEYCAKAFIIATGGFLGEGLVASPGKAREVIFDLPIAAPTDVADWSAPDIFGQHRFTRMGVTVDARLKPVSPNVHDTPLPAPSSPDAKCALLDNVHFAGRILAGYDFASEKSGNGVALATGYHAAKQVLHYV